MFLMMMIINIAPRTRGEGYDENVFLATMKIGTSNATGVAVQLPSDIPADLDVSKDDSTCL